MREVGKGKSDVLPPSIIPYSPTNGVGHGPSLNRIRTVTQRHFTARLGLDGMMLAVIGCCSWSDAHCDAFTCTVQAVRYQRASPVWQTRNANISTRY